MKTIIAILAMFLIGCVSAIANQEESEKVERLWPTQYTQVNLKENPEFYPRPMDAEMVINYYKQFSCNLYHYICRNQIEDFAKWHQEFEWERLIKRLEKLGITGWDLFCYYRTQYRRVGFSGIIAWETPMSRYDRWGTMRLIGEAPDGSVFDLRMAFVPTEKKEV